MTRKNCLAVRLSCKSHWRIKESREQKLPKPGDMVSEVFVRNSIFRSDHLTILVEIISQPGA